jgi:alpha-L-fucosidase
MFSDAGPDVRWIGNERGVAGETCWSTIDPAAVPYAGYDAPGVGELLQRGDPHGSVWRPGETDVSIRPGWFWHAAEDGKVRSPEDLLGLYFTSVGRNSKLLLNVPPTRAGTLHAADMASLERFARRRDALFASDLAHLAVLTADSVARGYPAARATDGDPATYWSAAPSRTSATLELILPRPVRCNTLRLGEPIALGQAVERFEFSGETSSGWQVLARGTTIGYCRLARSQAVTCRRFRLRLESGIDTIRLATLAMYDGES